MATIIVDEGNYIQVEEGSIKRFVLKPFDIDLKGNEVIFKTAVENYGVIYSDITTPSSVDALDLRQTLMAWNNTVGGEAMTDVLSNVQSKINRIKGAANYSRTLTYNLVGTENVETITHTGTTALGIETIIETITYVDPEVNGSKITNIVYS